MIVLALLAAVVAVPSLSAEEYRIEAIADAAPADELSAEIAALIDSSGVKVVKGASRTVCEIWLCKSWPVKDEFKATDAVAYPFSQGQLIGVVRYKNKGGDFRDQEIAKGVYTLRYAQQPVDGNHVGTSVTRDFLLLVNAEVDKSVKPIELLKLIEHSAAAAESKHPAMLALKMPKKGDAEKPSLVHDEDAELWLATLAGKSESGGKTAALPISVVVVGYANE